MEKRKSRRGSRLCEENKKLPNARQQQSAKIAPRYNKQGRKKNEEDDKEKKNTKSAREEGARYGGNHRRNREEGKEKEEEDHCESSQHWRPRHQNEATEPQQQEKSRNEAERAVIV